MDLNPLNQIDPVVIVVVAGIFWLTLTAMRKIFYLPYIEVMEAREQRLRLAEDQAAQAEAILREADEQAESVVEDARRQADHLLTQTRDRAESERRRASTTAGERIGKLLEEGRARIRSAKENELSQLRNQALDCVGIACTKLVGETDTAAVEAAVDKLLARRVS